ncbi:Z-ring-associated protein [Vibrio sp. 10N.286.49.C2]|uniref:cell division protein ZapA n=1 Tax=unclassified Vibrio TaxID=2614977 RepID=UPI000C8248D8|nr:MULTISPECIES: cell division protein ZapA [unclassified Vibrio]PMH29442.1 Z-ring-associated protein [Vibrio sp. 10N.286.49.C2]PMH55957.1 Z-ring-associated protein [Vibrio sp. 10N.286.49.B1]PMH81362.1 Z-ring-associated protein [Vibrio sp. 10N.286.48.B7]
MENQAVEVEILGKLTRVNCPAGQEETLIQAAKDLDIRLQEMTQRTKVTNELKLLTIAALNMSYELNTKSDEVQQNTSHLTERMEQLAASLDDAISNVKQGQ